MKLCSILLLIISITLVISSSWSLSNFIRLDNASKNYNTDSLFESACNVSKNYVKNGNIISWVLVVISWVILILSSVLIYVKY